MLQCFDHIILRLADGDILRDQASHLVPTQDDFLTLVWLFLAHNGRYYFQTIREKIIYLLTLSLSL